MLDWSTVDPVALNRRDVLVGLGATAVGALGVTAGEQAYAGTQRTAPLQFYGGFASGVRPDLSPPSVPGGSVVWSGKTGTRRVALTFDDGPMPDWTPGTTLTSRGWTTPSAETSSSARRRS